MTTKQAFFCAAVFGASLCYGQGNVVYYGANTNALNIVFEDTNLSVSNQTLIVADLNICLQSEWGKRAELRTGNNDPAFAAHLSFGHRSPYYDDFPKDIVAIPGGHALWISQELSDAYTNRLAFAAAHSNIVAAGYAFVAFVSSTNFPAIPDTDMPLYYFPKSMPDSKLITDAQSIISSLTSYYYYPPSIRQFGTITFLAEPGTEYLFMDIPASRSHGKGIIPWTTFPAIFHDGKWKFMDKRWFMN